MGYLGVFSPFGTTPIPSRGFSGRVRIAPMPSPEAFPTGRDRLFDRHLGVTEADGLGLAATTGPNHKLLVRTGRPAGAIAG